jgi:hypothetical protein
MNQQKSKGLIFAERVNFGFTCLSKPLDKLLIISHFYMLTYTIIT